MTWKWYALALVVGVGIGLAGAILTGDLSPARLMGIFSGSLMGVAIAGLLIENVFAKRR